jgi:hypothetical protein
MLPPAFAGGFHRRTIHDVRGLGPGVSAPTGFEVVRL